MEDNWDDYSYKTLFQFVYFDLDGKRKEIGSLKIMRKGMERERVEVKESFRKLTSSYASLGTDQSYYENVAALGESTASEIFASLRDLAWDFSLYESVRSEGAFQTSLMRGLRPLDINKFADIAHNRATLTPYHFAYTFPAGEVQPLEFKVTPHVLPPSNIHTIIGRNGVGKTRLLKAIISLLCDGAGSTSKKGNLSFFTDEDNAEGTFANLVNVAFSAFDNMSFPVSPNGTKTGIKMSYIGLRRPASAPRLTQNKAGEVSTVTDRAKEPKTQLKTISQLTKEFTDSFMTCRRSSKKQLWSSIVRSLESDPIFASMQLQQLMDKDEEEATLVGAKIFGLASSGHKIVLLSLTRLVELVEERTLVLIDEPEAHLHPPLQSAFIRALSSLLTARNGVGLLATHSPVMLQEVPRDCVWLLFRDGKHIDAQRPQVETFAENMGVLTREVFRVEVTESGFHNLLDKQISSSRSIEQLFAKFRNHVGSEGRAVARTLWNKKVDTQIHEEE